MLFMHSEIDKRKVKVLVTQSRLTLCDPMDCSPPGSSVHGILQARLLEWVANDALILAWTSLVAQWQRICLPTWEMCVQSLGWEDILEKEMATHSSILAWEIPWTEETGGLQSIALQKESDMT